jgi:hypothetical protein
MTMSKNQAELQRAIATQDRARVAAFEGSAYTLDDFRHEIEIYERLHNAWGLRFVQSVLQPSSTIWFAHDDAGVVKGAVKADRFEGDISKAEFVTFYWEPVRQGMMAAGSLGVSLRLVAASKGLLYSMKLPEFPAEMVSVGTRPDKDLRASEDLALILKIPRAQFKIVREP